MTWLKQARVLAPSEKQKEIDEKMQEVQKQASEGSLFGMTEEPAPVIPQPQGKHERSATARYANKHIPGATNPYYES